ncbi:MAG: molybdenum cofactor biosynthesis protein MoaE [Ignavibacteriae bacterium]|nr:molybdenum cofactor biosynthesis protein MoaE [Ignavibacteriota bacterium]
MIAITQNTIDVQAILASVHTLHSGAVDCFIGTIRNKSHGRQVKALEYTSYVAMAEKLMAEIETEMHQKWILHNIALVHRIGLLQVGDIAVVTAVSSAHRAEAFEACRYAIDRIKAVVPIWKKEIFEEGNAWVVGQHDVDYAGAREQQ